MNLFVVPDHTRGGQGEHPRLGRHQKVKGGIASPPPSTIRVHTYQNN